MDYSFVAIPPKKSCCYDTCSCNPRTGQEQWLPTAGYRRGDLSICNLEINRNHFSGNGMVTVLVFEEGINGNVPTYLASIQTSIQWSDILHATLGSNKTYHYWNDAFVLGCDCQQTISKQYFRISRSIQSIQLFHCYEGRDAKWSVSSHDLQVVQKARDLTRRPCSNLACDGWAFALPIDGAPCCGKVARGFCHALIQGRQYWRHPSCVKPCIPIDLFRFGIPFKVFQEEVLEIVRGQGFGSKFCDIRLEESFKLFGAK